MSVFYGLDTEAYDRQYSDSELLQRIVRYFAPHRHTVIIIGVLVAAISLIGAAQPLVVSRGLDLLVASPALSVVILISAAVLVIGVLNWTGNWCVPRHGWFFHANPRSGWRSHHLGWHLCGY